MAEMEGFGKCRFRRALSRRTEPHRGSVFDLSNPTLNIKRPHPAVRPIMAEMEGFEPPHGLRRLPDFESGPFSLLGTSPNILLKIGPKKQAWKSSFTIGKKSGEEIGKNKNKKSLKSIATAEFLPEVTDRLEIAFECGPFDHLGSVPYDKESSLT